jgi:hypothetical protein
MEEIDSLVFDRILQQVLEGVDVVVDAVGPNNGSTALVMLATQAEVRTLVKVGNADVNLEAWEFVDGAASGHVGEAVDEWKKRRTPTADSSGKQRPRWCGASAAGVGCECEPGQVG